MQIALRDQLDPLHVTVTPVLCVQGRGSGFGGTLAGVLVESERHLVRALTARPSVLSADAVQSVARLADERLRRRSH